LLLTLSPIEEGISPAEAAARAETAQVAVDTWLSKDQLPDRTRVSFKLLSGQVAAAKKDYAQAVRILRQLREESPRDPRIARVLAAVLFLAGEYRESLQEWNSLVVGLPQGREEWLTAVVEACRCHLELGDRASATGLLKIVETNHRGKGSEGVRKRLSEIQKRVER
jgi:lipopolysaccharide biosynthesis regulator YciM